MTSSESAIPLDMPSSALPSLLDMPSVPRSGTRKRVPGVPSSP